MFEDNRFKSESKKTSLKSVDIIGFGSGPELDQKLKYASDVCSGVIFGKELVNAPANVLTPGNHYNSISYFYFSVKKWFLQFESFQLIIIFICYLQRLSGALAEEASNIASTYSDVFTAKILDAEQCKELKMGSYLGVAAASSNPPHFLHLCYKPPNGDVKRKLAIVGKGLTFDR